MSDAVAIVGSRQGADLEAVERFVRALWAKYPDTLLVSGGADGVDKKAEQTWLQLGGHVWSFRPKEISPTKFGIEMWDLGGEHPRCFLLTAEPTWADWRSAALYRDMLIAEKADRVVAFYAPRRTPGTSHTIDAAYAEGDDIHEFEAAA